MAEPSRPAAPLLIFDIETVPDIPLLWKKAIGSDKFGSASRDREAESTWGDLNALQEVLASLDMDFPPAIYQSVVSICGIFVHPETYAIVDGLKLSVPAGLSYCEFLDREKRLLKDFWLFSKKHAGIQKIWYDSLDSQYRLTDFQRKKLKPIPVTFCGYNISGFDLPVLEQRSFRHLLTCPIAEYGLETGYDSYRSRFGFDKTFDLYQYLSSSGSAPSRVGLDVLARAIGLGGKMQGMDGSKVAEAYFADFAWQTIEDYCATDVLITYGVLLAVQKFRGVLSEPSFAAAVGDFQTFLLKEGRPETYRELERQSQEFFAHGTRSESTP
jgi:predicted PolB exonuclease-like 3'-5' exonuclease